MAQFRMSTVSGNYKFHTNWLFGNFSKYVRLFLQLWSWSQSQENSDECSQAQSDQKRKEPAWTETKAHQCPIGDWLQGEFFAPFQIEVVVALVGVATYYNSDAQRTVNNNHYFWYLSLSYRGHPGKFRRISLSNLHPYCSFNSWSGRRCLCHEVMTQNA